MEENKIKEVSVNFSKKIGLKNFSSAMLSASVTMTVEGNVKEAFKEAWGMAKEEVADQETEFKKNNDIEDVMDSVKQEVPATEDSAFCPIHKVKMQHYEKDGDEWWSHKVGDKWCNGRDTKYNKEL